MHRHASATHRTWRCPGSLSARARLGELSWEFSSGSICCTAACGSAVGRLVGWVVVWLCGICGECTSGRLCGRQRCRRETDVRAAAALPARNRRRSSFAASSHPSDRFETAPRLRRRGGGRRHGWQISQHATSVDRQAPSSPPAASAQALGWLRDRRAPCRPGLAPVTLLSHSSHSSHLCTCSQAPHGMGACG
jgi:hypothetical protein